ncbi:hypothetical protein Taro_050434 [Colocasia esculenta]|uniref:Uncharacterized protein n=1 Tax=Colocasia esculenta TaxID=4460 RepID=A0A843XDW9_COLES|nr:hypothetical protein [Colocasia esculenta]
MRVGLEDSQLDCYVVSMHLLPLVGNSHELSTYPEKYIYLDLGQNLREIKQEGSDLKDPS